LSSGLAGFVAALVDHLEAQFVVDKRRMFATDFSNGASMAFRRGIELSERITTVTLVSGALWIADP
jgi:polyhydroxybutyrate depolymerase